MVSERAVALLKTFNNPLFVIFKRTNSEDEIEIEGQKLAEERLGSSDIVICVVDSLRLLSDASSNHSTILELLSNSPEMSHPSLKKLFLGEDRGAHDLIVLLNKFDLLSSDKQRWLTAAIATHGHHSKVVCLSCKTREGVTQVVSMISNSLRSMFGDEDTHLALIPTRVRHQELLTTSLSHLRRFLGMFPKHKMLKFNHSSFYQHIENPHRVEVSAEELRLAAKDIGKITGKEVVVDDILDVIFRDFCIGK